MMRFILGLLVGVVLSLLYVRFDVALPDWMQMPERLRGNVVSTVAEHDLYDISQTPQIRQRALEVFFQNRAGYAAGVDAEAGHPFLKSLYRKRAVREARILRHAWSGFDVALGKPALRASLERKYGSKDTLTLKQAMLAAQFERHEFLASWIVKTYGSVSRDQLLGKIEELSKLP